MLTHPPNVWQELCGCISTALTLAARPPAAPADGSDGSTAPARGRAAAMDPGGPVARRLLYITVGCAEALLNSLHAHLRVHTFSEGPVD